MRISADTFYSRGWTPLGLLLTALLTGLLTGCGKIGEPLPPIARAALSIEELRVEQEGGGLVLRFPLARPREMRRVARVEVYRLVEEGSDPAGVPPDLFVARASVIAVIQAEQIPADRSTVTYVDPLDVKTLRAGIRYRYAVRVINRTGAGADLSNYALIQPLAEVAGPPQELRASQEERQIIITWNAPAANFNGTLPVNLAGYNLYRRAVGTEVPGVRLNGAPLRDPLFRDLKFEFGTSYEYQVRAVSRPAGSPDSGPGIESDASLPLVHTAQDTFPPTPPIAVTIASINRTVSIFWPLNSEPDVAGYNIYRAGESDGQLTAWQRLNTTIQLSGSWRDEKVTAGRTYHYRITAVDLLGNESLPSAVVSETVNP